MWYTLLHDESPIGVVELDAAGVTAGRMLRFPAYRAIRATTRAATAALLELGLFGGALPATPPFPRHILRLRRALHRGARLPLTLVDARGQSADAMFVNVLEPPGDRGIVVVAGFTIASAPSAPSCAADHVGAARKTSDRCTAASLR